MRITHLPTGIVVIQQDGEAQHKNRAKAMQVLRARLYDLRAPAGATPSAPPTARARSARGDRSERIRTYNFPQDRVTDHRIGLTLYKLDQVMQGDLDEVIDALHRRPGGALADLDA